MKQAWLFHRYERYMGNHLMKYYVVRKSSFLDLRAIVTELFILLIQFLSPWTKNLPELYSNKFPTLEIL